MHVRRVAGAVGLEVAAGVAGAAALAVLPLGLVQTALALPVESGVAGIAVVALVAVVAAAARSDGAARTIVVAAVLLLVSTAWAVSVPGSYFLAVLALSWLWVAAGFAWVVELAVRAFRRRPWTRADVLRRLAVPALAAATAAIVLTDLPFRARFELSRGAMDDVARDVAAGRRAPASIDRIGLWQVDRAERVRGGMRFLVAGTGFLDPAGFAYSPQGTPPVIGEDDYVHLEGAWYVWTESW